MDRGRSDMTVATCHRNVVWRCTTTVARRDGAGVMGAMRQCAADRPLPLGASVPGLRSTRRRASRDQRAAGLARPSLPYTRTARRAGPVHPTTAPRGAFAQEILR